MQTYNHPGAASRMRAYVAPKRGLIASEPKKKQAKQKPKNKG